MALLWNALHSYPAWRALDDSLRELEQLLRRAGRGHESAAGELADATLLLLTDPRTAADLLPADYRVSFPLTKARFSAEDDWDMEGQLSGWLTDLTRHVADVPLLLEAPEAARALGQSLATELPRAWQARLAVPLAHLRQMVRAAGRSRPQALSASAAPPAGAGLRLVVPESGTYHAVMQGGGGPDQAARVRRELLFLLLRDLGPDVARLHLQLLAAPEGAAAPAVCAALGIPAGRLVATERAYKALSGLRQVRLSLLTWAGPEGALVWERRTVPLWDVTVHEYGQACLDERSGALGAHGRQWSFVPGAESWAPCPALAGESRLLLEDLRGRRDGLSLAAAVLLGLADGEPAAVPNRAVVDLARLTPGAETPRARLKAAARLQRLAGWEPDFSAWPAEDAELINAVTVYSRITPT